jgi:hypothetical protein
MEINIKSIKYYRKRRNIFSFLNEYTEYINVMQETKLIVYYSWVGSTRVVAQFIERQTSIKAVRIEEIKPRPLSKIMSAAMGAFFGSKSKLKTMDYEMQHIDTLL